MGLVNPLGRRILSSVASARLVSIVEADGEFLQLVICQVGRPAIFVVTAATGEVESQIRLGRGSIVVKLGLGQRIDRHEMGTKIAAVLFGIAHRTLGHIGHMAVNALGMAAVGDLLINVILEVTVLTLSLDAKSAGILDGLVGIVAIDAAHDALSWIRTALHTARDG